MDGFLPDARQVLLGLRRTPLTFAALSIVLFGAAGLGSWLSARRATRVDVRAE